MSKYSPLGQFPKSRAIALVIKNGQIIDESPLPLAGGPVKRRFTGR